MSASKKKTGRPLDPASLALLVRQTRNLLVCHQSLGLTSYPAVPELRKFAATRSRIPRRPVSPQPPIESPQARYSAGPKKATPPPDHASAKDTPQQIAAIAEALSLCRNCPSAGTVLPGQGHPSPELMVVGDCFIGSAPRQGLLWGAEIDGLFWKMMAAINLDRNTVYVTNAVKCARKKGLGAGDDRRQLRACLPWLEKELRAVQPRLICAMGDTAARVLLRSNTLTMRHLGRFHPCRFLRNSPARVLPTLHPRVLLRHPDMKQAAWQHLQLLQRQL